MSDFFPTSPEDLLSSVSDKLTSLVTDLNSCLAHYQPLQVVGLTLGVAWALGRLHRGYKECNEEGLVVVGQRWLLKQARRLPWVERKVKMEIDKNLDQLKEDVAGQMAGLTYLTSLPKTGWSEEKVVEEVKIMLGMGDFKVETGAFSGICHQPVDDKRVNLVTQVYSMAAYTNPLNPDAYPGVRKMEAEVIRMTGDLFHGPADMVGSMTSGGTESLILSVLAYRGYAREHRGITRPNLVMPDTGHVGIDKAGHVLGVTIRHVKVDPETLLPKISSLRRACDSNTIMLLASAPEYAHGLMDPVEDIARLGLELNIPVHVDACLGGFLVGFLSRLDIHLQPFDFRLEGVTSMSADTHKFGYSPKGSSVIMYREKKYIHHQYFVSKDWTGGIFASPTLAGSRSGGVVAATWSALVHHGMSGYTAATRDLLDAAWKVREGVRGTPGLRLLGEPQLCIVSFTSDTFHIYSLADEMKTRGWLLTCIQHPVGVHLYLVPSHTRPGVVDNFLADLTVATEKIAASPQEMTGRAAVYGMAQRIPDTLVHEMAAGFMDILYSTQ